MDELNLFEIIIFYTLQFIFIAGVAVGGVFLGKFLRERKDEKNDTREFENSKN